MKTRAAVVIAAGGTGRRMARDTPKQYLLLEGEPLLLRSLRPFLQNPAVEWAIVALPAEDATDPPAWLAVDDRITVVAGGAERGDSVRSALEAVPEAADVVLVHDAARPLVRQSVIDRTIAAAAAGVGAVAAIPVADTIKEVDQHGRIVATPDRRQLWRAQTPQGFPRFLIQRVYRQAEVDGVQATDDAALVERYGGIVRVVEGSPDNLKVTGPDDLVIAAALLRGRLHGNVC